MKSNNNFTHYLAWFGFPVLTFFIIAIPLSLFFEPVSGDLTRIGHWSERDFGWNKSQATVSIRANGTWLSAPEIIVLGDSFSHPNIWQSYLSERQSVNIISFQYQDVGCVSNWLSWMANEDYLKARTVIIEIVERSFIPVFRKLNHCSNLKPKALNVDEKNLTPVRKKKGLTLDAGYLFPTAMNTLQAFSSDERIISGNVVNMPLTTSALFSNHISDRLLYFTEDDLKMNWSDKEIALSVASVKSIQDDLEEKMIRLVVVIVPDKSTTYRNFFANEERSTIAPNIFEQLKLAGVNNVNLKGAFQQKAGEVVDFYLPNDTHLSNQGYKLMAMEIAEYLNSTMSN